MFSLNFVLLVGPIVGLVAIVYAIHLVLHDLLGKSKGPSEMVEIHDAIKVGANTYLALQFFVAALFVGGITAVLSYVCLLYTSDAAEIERCRSRWSPYH